MKKQLKEISFLKTIMMLSVVLYHSCLFFKGSWFTYSSPVYDANYINVLSFWLNTFHIQTFTFASGFIFFYLKSIGKYKDPKVDIKNRTKRLLLPLVFAEIFWIIPFYIYYYGFNISTIIKKFILLESPSQLWFLPMLFLVFVFFYNFYNKINFSFKNIIFIYIITFIIGTILSRLNLNYFNICNAVRYSLYFYLGGYIHENKEIINNKYLYVISIFAILIIGYLIFSQTRNIAILKYIDMLVTPILSCLEAILLYKMSDYIVNTKRVNLDNKIYALLQENSFGIYLFHQQIIWITITIFNGIVHPIIQCILSFIISLVCSLIISIVLKNIKVTKKCLGL